MGQQDEPAGVLGELEAAVASHLEAPAVTGRGHGRRPRGRLVGVVSLGGGGTEPATVLLAHTALAASRMLRRPALLLDLTDSVAAPSHARELPGLADLVAQPGLLAAHDAFARARGAHLGIARVGSAAEPAAGAVVDMLAELTRRYALVVVHVTPAASARAAVAQVADMVIAAGTEADAAMLRRGRLPAERDVIVLAAGRAGASEGDRRRLEDACRANVLRVVPAGALSVVRADGGAADAREPWRSVDWLARHMLQRKVGLALGAGATGGYAHLGVLAALAARGLTVDYLAASGIGAPVAAGTALGLSPVDIRRHLDDVFRLLAKPRLPWAAHGTGAALHDVFARMTAGRAFEDLRAALALVATDLDRGASRVLDSGPLGDAILASMAIPAALPPVTRDGRRLVDGGVLDPLPAGVLSAAGADVVIGVRLAPAASSPARDAGWRDRLGAADVEPAVRAFDLMQARLALAGADGVDVLVEPELRGGMALRDRDHGDAMIAAGHAATEAAMGRLRARLALDVAGTLAATPDRVAA